MISGQKERCNLYEEGGAEAIQNINDGIFLAGKF